MGHNAAIKYNYSFKNYFNPLWVRLGVGINVGFSSG